MNAPIRSFTGSNRWLSNFYIEPDGTHVEGEYQSSKCANPNDKTRFIGLSPGAAKRLGRAIEIRKDWNAIKNLVMFELVLNKFRAHPDLADKLIATGDALLEEGNSWGDVYWGTYNGHGDNILGKILMITRNIINGSGEIISIT